MSTLSSAKGSAMPDARMKVPRVARQNRPRRRASPSGRARRRRSADPRRRRPSRSSRARRRRRAACARPVRSPWMPCHRSLDQWRRCRRPTRRRTGPGRVCSKRNSTAAAPSGTASPAARTDRSRPPANPKAQALPTTMAPRIVVDPHRRPARLAGCPVSAPCCCCAGATPATRRAAAARPTCSASAPAGRLRRRRHAAHRPLPRCAAARGHRRRQHQPRRRAVLRLRPGGAGDGRGPARPRPAATGAPRRGDRHPERPAVPRPVGLRRARSVLVHHCHREQWPVAGRFMSRLGWFVESRLSPRLHRRNQYVTVSLPSARDLVDLGVDPEHIAVVRNGLDEAPADDAERPAVGDAAGGRAVTAGAAQADRGRAGRSGAAATSIPDLHLDVVGGGWWERAAGRPRRAARDHRRGDVPRPRRR